MSNHLWPPTGTHDAAVATASRVIVEGCGCSLKDADGRWLLDAASGRFAVQIGYSFGSEMGEVAARQLEELPASAGPGYAHPRALELAREVALLAPDGLDHVFFTASGTEAVEAAWKLARQFHALGGERRWKAIGRDGACHGSTMGALSIGGVAKLRAPFEPLVPRVAHVRNTDRSRRPVGETEQEFCAFLLDDLAQTIWAEGPETIAMMILEPVQCSGGSLTAPAGYFDGVRALCDEHGILLCADEAVTGFGRVGDWFASQRLGLAPDLITCARGLSSGYGAIGALIVSDAVADAFRATDSEFAHDATVMSGHPLQAALALKSIEIIRREGLVERVRRTEEALRETLEELRDLPVVGDVRGAGFLQAIELVKDETTDERFSAAERDWLVQSFLPARLHRAGMVARVDDRGEPVLHVAPPLVAGRDELEAVGRMLWEVLGDVADRVV